MKSVEQSLFEYEMVNKLFIQVEQAERAMLKKMGLDSFAS
jgi:hypothetical protein